MPDTSTILRVADVQMESRNGLVEANLQHAAPLVNRAAEMRARLVLLPELMPPGYVFTTAIWDGAEPKEGLTATWLKETSKRLGIWLGTSFLEADGEDFFNTFVLATPDGREAGRVRKQKPASCETYFTRGYVGPHVMETELGRIGVGICYENQLAYIPRIMCRQSVDLLLMPHSIPVLMRSFFFSGKQVERYRNAVKELALRYARMLGVPVVMANKCGPWVSPMPGIPFPVQHSSFPGLSAVVDSDGTLKAQLGDEEGVIVEDVRLDPSRKIHTVPQSYGRWTWKDPYGFSWLLRSATPVTEACGRLWYSLSRERRRRELGQSPQAPLRQSRGWTSLPTPKGHPPAR